MRSEATLLLVSASFIFNSVTFYELIFIMIHVVIIGINVVVRNTGRAMSSKVTDKQR